jgi:hypothetical protein
LKQESCLGNENCKSDCCLSEEIELVQKNERENLKLSETTISSLDKAIKHIQITTISGRNGKREEKL